MRVIIRFSLDHDQGSKLRNKLAHVLEAAGMTRDANTATYEAVHLSNNDIASMLSKFWKKANSHAGPGRLDHFWMYSDQSAIDLLDHQ